MTIDDDGLQEALLFEYACGALDEASSLLIATWLTLSPPARRAVARFEACGGALMDHVCEPVRMNEGSLDHVLGRLCDDVSPCGNKPCSQTPSLPGILQPYISGEAAWRTARPGIKIVEIALPSAPRRAVVTSLRPGRTTPRQRCEGMELALIIEGAYSDGRTVYRQGRLVISAPGLPVRRRADERLGCLYFTVSEERERPSPLGDILRFFRRKNA